MDEQKDDSHEAYYSLTTLAEALDVSEKTLRRWMADPVNPLPTHHVRGGGKGRGRVIILKSELDTWLKTFPPSGATPGRPDMDRRVAEAVRSMRGR